MNERGPFAAAAAAQREGRVRVRECERTSRQQKTKIRARAVGKGPLGYRDREFWIPTTAFLHRTMLYGRSYAYSNVTTATLLPPVRSAPCVRLCLSNLSWNEPVKKLDLGQKERKKAE